MRYADLAQLGTAQSTVRSDGWIEQLFLPANPITVRVKGRGVGSVLGWVERRRRAADYPRVKVEVDLGDRTDHFKPSKLTVVHPLEQLAGLNAES